MPRALVVADDLTGATDTGHAFAARSYRTRVQVDRGGRPPEATVRAVDLDSRYADSDVAAERVRAAVEAADGGGDPVVYKKVDSTLRGNVVREIDAAMDATDAALGIVAPAAPAVGRTTAAGHHLVDGRPLVDTEYADDPKGPTTARLPTLLAGWDRPVVHLEIGTVVAGDEAVGTALADAPSGALVACDAIHERHLETIARAAGALEDTPVYAGSAGLAAHVGLPGGPDADEVDFQEAGSGVALGIVGSVSETTLEQLRAIPGEWTIALEPEAVVRDPERAGHEAAERASARLASGESAAVTAAPDRTALDRTLEAGARAGLDAAATGARVARALGVVAGATLRGRTDDVGLFVTGGDVARAVFDALGATTLALSGWAVESGIPLGRVDDGPAAGTPVVTKAGGFGGRETAVNCLRFLAEGNEREHEE